MIRANHTFLGKQVCSFYAGYKLEQAFRTIEIRGDQADLQLPVLILANHFSKWDGFIQYRINRILYRRKFHVMMLEEQLLKHPILRKGGAFSVRKKLPGESGEFTLHTGTATQPEQPGAPVSTRQDRDPLYSTLQVPEWN